MEHFLASQPIPQPPSPLPPPPPHPHPRTTDGLILGVLMMTLFLSTWPVFLKLNDGDRQNPETDIEIGDVNLNHDHHSRSHDSTPTTNVIPKRSIEQKLMEMAPSFVYGDEGGAVKCSTSECVICWEDFEDGEICRVLPACSHVFHKACVGLWLMEKSVCPLCRVGVDV